jgi:protein-S-isoprenylcysteine O-methyltransferase Ste14
MPTSDRPRSATHFGVNVVALIAGLSTLSGLVHWQSGALEPMLIVLLSAAVIGVTVIAGERWWRGRFVAADSGLWAPAPRRLNLATAVTRLLGLAATFGAIAFLYWLFPEYRSGFYAPFWRCLQLLAPWGLAVAVVYFLWADARLLEPRDAYWRIGRVCLGCFADRPSAEQLRAHALGWAVKAYFLPLMVVYARDQVSDLEKTLAAIPSVGLVMSWYPLLFRLAFVADLLFCVVGYVLTLRLFDSHIRSTDSTASGWLVALICYQPLYSVIGGFYLHYDDSPQWTHYLEAYPNLSDIWGAIIIALVIVYGLSTVAFGLRFSNLTNRGIVTCGPYRYTKHPAYLAKNLSWWLISVPFLGSAGTALTVRHCLMLGLLNGVYYLRAKTEERHLRQDPEYVAYAAWIERHGCFARIRRATREVTQNMAHWRPRR